VPIDWLADCDLIAFCDPICAVNLPSQAISALSYIERSVSEERIPLIAAHRPFNRMSHYTAYQQHGRFGRVQSNIGEWHGSDIASQVTKTLKSAIDVKIWHEKVRLWRQTCGMLDVRRCLHSPARRVCGGKVMIRLPAQASRRWVLPRDSPWRYLCLDGMLFGGYTAVCLKERGFRP